MLFKPELLCDLRPCPVFSVKPVKNSVSNQKKTAESIFRTLDKIAFVSSSVFSNLESQMIIILEEISYEVVLSRRSKEIEFLGKALFKSISMISVIDLQYLKCKILIW